MTNLQELKNRIYELCPDKHHIGLEAVLKAIGDREDVYFSRFKNEFHIKKGNSILCAVWQLGKTLNDQNPETINFLHNLICK
jgi:hypothetical protein